MPFNVGTYLGEVYGRSHDEARALIRRALEDQHGHVTNTARALGVSRPFLHWVMRKVGISREAIEIRARHDLQFRLPPLECGNTEEEPAEDAGLE